VLKYADSIAIMRDGALVAHEPASAFDVNRMIALMVGRSIEQLYPPRTAPPTSEPVLQVENVTAAGVVENITFDLLRGEVLGVFGLMGSGRTELVRILFGLEPFERGKITLNGRDVGLPTPRESIRAGMAFVTENRREEGLLMSIDIANNIGMVALPQYADRLLQIIRQRDLSDGAGRMAGALQLKSGDIRQQNVKALSGGNQQKVVIAKWLLNAPTVFILDEPTRGIDVGAKYEIYTIIDRLAAEGGGVLIISSELEELMGMCDRILVMSRGEIVGQFARADFNDAAILRAAFREAESNGAMS